MPIDAVQRALGVTRVARVTGLDRSGVEVACAVRPGGHVLQISNGKGESWEQARASALSEAAELWAAERPHGLIHGSVSELALSGENVLYPNDLVAPRLWSRETRIAWVRATSGALVPAQAVYCPPQGRAPLGPAVFRWSTNGMGAHPLARLALQHAVLEALERDQLARTLPHGWTREAISTRKLDASSLPLWQRLREARLEAHVFDLSARELPVAGALLVDLDQGPVPLTAGYACALRPERAVIGALLEAAQSRLTEMHGAREDVAHSPEPRGLRQACERARPVRRLRDMPSARRLPTLRRAAVVELASRPLHVVKVIAPELRLSELL
ncbi:MAG: fatty acid-binding protein [Deltaproteobacteria bacterium]|nr:MAG: fatty acid-binding protein [Deltaproteobacteria bacterium]